MIQSMDILLTDSINLLATVEISPWWRFFGRLHPLLLHFPIAMLVAAAAVELVLCWKREARPNGIASFCLWVGMISAVLASWTGWEMAANEGIEGNPVKASLLVWHRWTGVVLAGLSIALCISWLIERLSQSRWSFHVYRFGVWAAGILVCFVGHFGAEMKWGRDYLFSVLRTTAVVEEATNGDDGAAEPKSETEQRVTPASAAISWKDQIEPILQASCADCHGPEKQKGRLQLVPWEAFRSHLSMIDVNDPAASLLVHRVSLPVEDPDAMPPGGPPLAADQIELIKTWIGQGAPGGQTAAVDSKDSPEASSEPARRTDPASKVPSPFDAANQLMAMNAIRDLGGHAVPVSEQSPWIDVNLSLIKPPVTNEQIAILSTLKSTLIWLNLGATAVTDEGVEQTVSQLKALHRLRLDRTAVGDRGIDALGDLQALEVLNLFGTSVTDDCLSVLERMSSLKTVYLWDTGVSTAGMDLLRKARPDLEVVGGPSVPATTASPAAEASGD